MFPRHRSRLVSLLRACLIVSALLIALRHWQVSSGAQLLQWDSSHLPTHWLSFDQEGISHASRFKDVATDDIITTPASPGNSQAFETEQEEDGASGIDIALEEGDPLPLPAEYSSPAPISDFCASRFTTKWFDILREGHMKYCLDSAASALHCFHTPPGFHNDEHVDTFCIGRNAAYDPIIAKFKLDCPLTTAIPEGKPRSPKQFHEYWYETGPGPIFRRWITLDNDRAASISRQTAGNNRTFTYLLNRDQPHNIFHSLHELMVMTHTFDVLRTTRDPATGRPFFVAPDDVANTQILILDDHEDGPYFDLWKMFSGREPMRLKKPSSGSGRKSGGRTRTSFPGHDDDADTHDEVRGGRGQASPGPDRRQVSGPEGGEREEDLLSSWLAQPVLDNVIVPLAGAANPVWHDNWESWDCVNELRTVFVRRVLDLYASRQQRQQQREQSPDGKDHTAAQEENLVEGKEEIPGHAGDAKNEMLARQKAPLETHRKPRNGQERPLDAHKEDTSKDENADENPDKADREHEHSGDRGEDTSNAHKSSNDRDASKPRMNSKLANKPHLKASPSPSRPPSDYDHRKDPSTSLHPFKPFHRAETPPTPPESLKITFIDRKDTRRIQNTSELLEHARAALSAEASSNRLIPVHIEAIDFATLPFHEQIAVAQQTDVLVGVHGAGLTHSLFMRQDMGAVVEIFPEAFELRCFRAMARDMGLRYYKIHVPVVEENEDFHVVDLVVDNGDDRDRFVDVLRHAVKALDNRPGNFRDF